MTLRKVYFSLVIPLSLFCAGHLFSADPIRIVFIDYTLAETPSPATQAISEQFLLQMNSSLRQELPNVDGFEVLDVNAVRALHEVLLKDPQFQGRENSLFLELGKRLRADVVIFGRAFTQDPNQYKVETRLVYVNRPNDTQDFPLEEPRFREANLRGSLVLRITERIQRYFARSGSITETSIGLHPAGVTAVPGLTAQPPRYPGGGTAASSGRDTFSNTIFFAGLSGDGKENGMFPMFGIDFVFDKASQHFSFGFGAACINGKSLSFSPLAFLEAHLFPNDFYRLLQLYFRTGVGMPISFGDNVDASARILAMLGTRISAGHFLFDVGCGYDYYSTDQKGVLYLRAGTGFHF